MKLLRNINKLIEDAVGGSTGAGSIGSFAGGLFPGGYINGKVSSKEKKKLKVKPIFKTLKSVNEDANKQFDQQDADSKMDSAEKRSQMTRNVSVFGIEDELGKVIKLYVSKDQGDAFEKELSMMMFKAEDAEEPLDVAEVIYELGKKFNIMDADWGDSIIGDEEQEEVPPGGPGAKDQPEGEAGDQAAGGEEGAEGEMTTDELGTGDAGDAGDATAASALQQVIDMMKSDAEAKKAEANARTAEARAREAEAAARSSREKVKQEEEILDMEDYNNSKAEEDKEAKRLAQLAKYRHDKAREAEGILNQEGFKFDNKRTLNSVIEVADIIFENLMRQGIRNKNK